MNRPINNKAEIISREIRKEFTYDSKVMLTLDISYPEIKLNQNSSAQNRINRYYQFVTNKFYVYAYTNLYPSAINYYLETIQNDFPFHAYDAVMKYTVTLNDNCHLSTYFDQYQFTGGAHGNTIRSSVNWNLQMGNQIKMKDLFMRGQNFEQLVLSEILKMADMNMKQDPGIYFEDYRALIVKYFNINSFYLTPTGLSVYYQQYEIVPYVTSIVVFNIPYKELGIGRPNCKY